MPASSLLYEMEPNNGSTGSSALEDQRALQLALELSMLGLSSDNNDPLQSAYDADSRNKKSQNTTECVPVPSSEHVAEIVGRQGCKIKALRAKTNTYIKTPVRGEEPVFVVTGRKEDVNAAKREILSAAEHFSQIRAQRKNNLNGTLGGTGGPNASIPGQTTIQVRVPYRVVGLVVGPKGATIKRIQQQTNTYIITPSRDKEPVFEVTGLPENVETARKEIEAHIAMRTGGLIDSANGAVGDDDGSSDFGSSLNGANPFSTNGTTNGFGSLYKSSDPFSAFSNGRDSTNLLVTPRSSTDIFNFANGNGNSKFSDIYSSFSSNGFTNGFGSYDTDEGIGESPTFDSIGVATSIASSVWPDFTSRPFSSAISPLGRRSSSLGSPTGAPSVTAPTTDATSLIDPLLLDHPPARRICSDPLSSAFSATTTTTTSTLGGFPTVSSTGSTSTTSSSSPTESLGSIGSIGGGRKLKPRDCIVCFGGEIVAALVPCGHNFFCMECASRVCEKADAECPVCHQHVSQAIRIFSS